MKFVAPALALLAFSAVAHAQGPDLASMIECRADARDYNGFAMSFAMDPGIPVAAGWKEVPTSNPMLAEYRLPASIEVFGHATNRVAFVATGVLAIIDGVAADELAKALGIESTVGGDKFLGEKVLVEDRDESDGLTTTTRVSLNISTVDSHPGSVLAGCSYRIEVE